MLKKKNLAMLLLASMLVWTVCSGCRTAEALQTDNEPLYPIFENGYWGLINASGKIILPPRFQAVSRFPSSWNPARLSNSVSAAIDIANAHPVTETVIPVRLDGKAGFASRKGDVLAWGRYDEIWWRSGDGLFRIRSGSLYGFADHTGKLVIPARFALAWSFKDGYAFVKINGRWGVIDRNGRLVAAPVWDQVESPGLGLTRVSVRKGRQWGAVERSGTVVIPIRFDQIARPTGSLIAVVDAGKYVYIRPDGTVAFAPTCKRKLFGRPKARGFPFFGPSAIVKCGNRYGLVDLQGRFLLDPVWDDIGPFSEQRAIVVSGSKQGLIDQAGRFIIKPAEIDLGAIGEGRVAFSMPGPDGKQSGYYDLDGHMAVKGRFEKTLAFSEGRAVVRLGGKDGYMDRSGAWVVAPAYWRANPFHGPLATVEQPQGKAAKAVSYIDRGGNIVYRMLFNGYINR